MMKLISIFKIMGNLMTMLLFGIVITVGVVAISSKAFGHEPNFLGYQIKTVLSGSMEPGIQTGSIIIIKQVEKQEDFSAGDVITYITKENVLVTHRIADVKGSAYITKGDNNNGVDIEPVLRENIIGKYADITIPYVGYVFNFASTKLGNALLIVLPGLYLIVYSLFGFRRKSEKTDMEKLELQK